MLMIDTTATGQQATGTGTVTSGAYSTTATNTLLLAFIGTDNATSTIASVTGSSLTWQLVQRVNVQNGTAEIWRAFSPAQLSAATVTANASGGAEFMFITVVAIIGADTSGTNGSGAIGAVQPFNSASGNPTGTITTTRDNSWIFACGNDWATFRTVTAGTNQTKIAQNTSAITPTIWAQRQNKQTTDKGTVVTMNATTNAADVYNWNLIEVLPASQPTVINDYQFVKAGNGISVTEKIR